MTDRLIHFSARPLGPVRSVPQEDTPHFKPRGLWVSVEGPRDDGWSAWCKTNDFGQLACAHEIKLRPGVLRITNQRQFDAFTEEYGNAGGGGRFDIFSVAWARVAAKFPGIIIAPYLWSRRMEPAWYYAWDCASGCIWDASVIESVTLLEVV